MNEKVRTATRVRREFMPVLDPDFDDDGWKPLLGRPEQHPDSWGAHDYAGVLSGEQHYHGLSEPYHKWRAKRAERSRYTPEVVKQSLPEIVGTLDWHLPELIEEKGRFPQALAPPAPDKEPVREIERTWWPTDGRLMPVLRADEDYEYLRQRYGKSFWAALLGYLNGRIEPWFRKDVERIKRCVIVDDD
jgi:hypothetical protein